ncbi:mechanosensitive ion channel family protein [Formosa undariae]|uniref:Mechanosensitive ion channel family protein n=1 Tax=Formosa undariae TaxID=1325436 RepID=A0ABV5F5F3_9FLAO
MKKNTNLIISGILLILVLSLQLITDFVTKLTGLDFSAIADQQNNLFIAVSAWVAIIILRRLKTRFLKRYDISQEDNLHSRKVYTQFNILEKVIIFVIIIVAVGLILLSFEGIRKIGVGLFASAGVAGIILGLSAQKVVGALLAGIQIAITQPFRIDDAVVVEGEWGWIEEINLTYVVVRVWDKRRLVLPSSYFLEKPFQNWTRNNADIMGTVFLYTDYNIPFNDLRTELTRLLNASDLWDGKVNVLQVTESKETTVESRILVSARNSPMAWDLRVHIREKMIEYIQINYPDSLPRTRVVIENKATNQPPR